MGWVVNKRYFLQQFLWSMWGMNFCNWIRIELLLCSEYWNGNWGMKIPNFVGFWWVEKKWIRVRFDYNMCKKNSSFCVIVVNFINSNCNSLFYCCNSCVIICNSLFYLCIVFGVHVNSCVNFSSIFLRPIFIYFELFYFCCFVNLFKIIKYDYLCFRLDFISII